MPTIDEMLEDCQNAATCSNSPFSKWETDFIESVAEQHQEFGSLSEKQQDKLEQIWDKI